VREGTKEVGKIKENEDHRLLWGMVPLGPERGRVIERRSEQGGSSVGLQKVKKRSP